VSAEPVTTYRDTPFGRMRSRALGSPQHDVPEVVLVQGVAVADYLLPGLAALGVVLASPTIDPRYRGWGRLFVAWQLDGRREPPGLTESHKPEWKRAGPRRLLHVVRIHLADRLEDVVPQILVPVLVLHGDQDRDLAGRLP
jgi:hypothetical protein